jgi:hypothetical protein
VGLSLKRLVKPVATAAALFNPATAPIAWQFIQQDAQRSAANRAADQARQMQQDQLAAQVQINKDNASYAAATAQANAQTQLSGGTPRNSMFPMWQQFSEPSGGNALNIWLIGGALLLVVLLMLRRG